MKRQLASGLAVGLLLSGCATYSSKIPGVEAPVPAAYVEAPAPSDPGGRPEAPDPGLSCECWWQNFQDPALEELMAEAFHGNLQLSQAYARLEQFLATTRIAGAAEVPAVGLDAEANRSHQPGIKDDTTTTGYHLSAAAQYEIDLWGKLGARTRAAEFDALAQREAVLTLYLSLSAQVADLYYLAVEQREQLALTDRTIGSFQEALERVERRYRSGLVSSLDVYQARQNLAGARARRPAFEATLGLTEHALCVLLGRAPDGATGGSLATLPNAPPLPDSGLPSDLLSRRPDVRLAFARLASSDARIAAAVADRLPAINLLASLGTSRTVFEAGTASGVFWNLIAGLTQPVFDGGRRKAEVERTEAVYREALEGYRETVLIAIREVEDSLLDNRTTGDRIRRLEELVAASEEGLRVATDRYLEGLSDYLPVLDTQARLFESQSSLLASRRQLISDRIGLVRALGGDWMERELTDRAVQPRADAHPALPSEHPPARM